VPGTKKKPYRLKTGLIQKDNVALELNTVPATDVLSWERNFLELYGEADRLMNKRGFTIVNPVASFIFSEEALKQDPDTLVFGCDRDYDAFEPTNPCKVIVPAEMSGLRTFGGHVHIGHPNAINYPELVCLACDLYLGLPSILFDQDTLRRKLYGKASRYRPKPYGIEYRTLSNFWTKNTHFIKWVYRMAEMAAENPFSIFELEGIVEFSKVVSAINNNDVKFAQEITAELDIEYPERYALFAGQGNAVEEEEEEDDQRGEEI
jgi:hypothetical protein